MDIKEEISAEALRIVTGSRRAAYGTPERNFERIAVLWQSYLVLRQGAHKDAGGGDWNIEPRDVAAMMRLMKEARLIETPDHRDSFIDLVGYSLCGAEVSGVKPIVEELADRVAEPEIDRSPLAYWNNTDAPAYLRAEVGDEVLVNGMPDPEISDDWYVVKNVDNDGDGMRLAVTERGWWVYDRNVIDVRKPATPSDTPAATWSDPDNEDGA